MTWIRTGPAGTLFAAWTESLNWYSDAPVTLARHANEMTSKVVLDRALTTGLALPQSGPEVAANEWVGAGELGLGSESADWAGTIVRGRQHAELDGYTRTSVILQAPFSENAFQR